MSTTTAPAHPQGFWALWWASPAIRRETTSEGGYQTYTPYQPTDWSVEDDEILDGWDEKNGTCPTCFQLRTPTGACGC